MEALSTMTKSWTLSAPHTHKCRLHWTTSAWKMQFFKTHIDKNTMQRDVFISACRIKTIFSPANTHYRMHLSLRQWLTTHLSLIGSESKKGQMSAEAFTFQFTVGHLIGFYCWLYFSRSFQSFDDLPSQFHFFFFLHVFVFLFSASFLKFKYYLNHGTGVSKAVAWERPFGCKCRDPY